EPLILSGPHTIAFSQRHARAAVQKLGAEVVGIGKLVAEWEAAEQTVPAPVMRFPYRPPADLPALKLAEGVRAEGFDTVIVLPLRAEQIKAVRAELAGQLQQMSGDSVLFCYHLEQLMVEADALGLRRSWSLIRDGSSECQTIIIDGG